MSTLPVWAELAEQADATGWLAHPSENHDSHHCIERRQGQCYGREHICVLYGMLSNRATRGL